MEIAIHVYLWLYGAYFMVRIAALYNDKQIRLMNEKTHLQYLKELGGIVFSYQTIFWFYCWTLI